VKREWGVVGFLERPRRKINHGSVQKRRWWRRPSRVDRRDHVEWVLVLKGETVDRKERITPDKNASPGEPKNEEKQIDVLQLQAQQQAQLQAQQHAQMIALQQSQMQNQIHNPANVLRHIELKRPMGVEEAEMRMDEMLKDLFKFEEPDVDDEEDLMDFDDEQESKKSENLDFFSPCSMICGQGKCTGQCRV